MAIKSVISSILIFQWETESLMCYLPSLCDLLKVVRQLQCLQFINVCCVRPSWFSIAQRQDQSIIFGLLFFFLPAVRTKRNPPDHSSGAVRCDPIPDGFAGLQQAQLSPHVRIKALSQVLCGAEVLKDDVNNSSTNTAYLLQRVVLCFKLAI